MGLLSWAKGVVNKLINKSDIENALRKDIAISDNMDKAIKLWSDMYNNIPPWQSKTVQTLNMPAVIASKMAKISTIEAEIDITGSKRADYIAEQMQPLINNLRNITEYTLAKGGLMFKPFIDGNRVIIDCVQAGRFFPLRYDSNGNINACIFVAQSTNGDDIYTRLEQHEFNNGKYTITNKAYVSRDGSRLGDECGLGAVDEWKDIQTVTTIYNLEAPLFVYFKMPFANNIDVVSPLGVSIYSRATETIKQLDKQYSRLLWEFEGGELAVHASEDLFKYIPAYGKVEGETVLPEGGNRLYRLLDQADDNGKNFFQVYSPAFRDVSLINGFNMLLRQIEAQCGLAFGTVSDPENIDKTATEIIYSKQESYSTVVDIQKALEKAITGLAGSIDALATASRDKSSGEYEISFYWDDSIVVDKDKKREQFWQYVTAGKFPMWKFLVEYEGYTEEEARQLVSQSNTSVTTLFDGT